MGPDSTDKRQRLCALDAGSGVHEGGQLMGSNASGASGSPLQLWRWPHLASAPVTLPLCSPHSQALQL